MRPTSCPKHVAAIAWGTRQVLDHMFFDGLQSPFDGNMMGHFAEVTARKYNFSREDQDKFAIESVTRAREAVASGAFKAEIAPVTLKTRKGEVTVSEDDGPTAANVEKIPTLRPAFAKDGTVTAASSSSISDGAAALICTGQARPRVSVSSPWQQSPAMQALHMHPSGLRCPRFRNQGVACRSSVGIPATWTFMKSTKHLPVSLWRP